MEGLRVSAHSVSSLLFRLGCAPSCCRRIDASCGESRDSGSVGVWNDLAGIF